MPLQRRRPHVYAYETCCINSTAEAIVAMTDNAREVTYQTMLKRCPGLLDWASDHGYERDARRGLTLKADWHVSYHKSIYRGRHCFYLVWSAIEFIFTPAYEIPGNNTRDLDPWLYAIEEDPAVGNWVAYGQVDERDLETLEIIPDAAEPTCPSPAARVAPLSEIIELLDNVTASLETMLCHYGKKLPAFDRAQRWKHAADARRAINHARGDYDKKHCRNCGEELPADHAAELCDECQPEPATT